MNLTKFLRILYGQFNNVFCKDKIVFGKYKGDLGYSESTLLINVIFYNTIKEYNKTSRGKLQLSPEHGGRSPSDFCILNKKGGIELYIEHENSPNRIFYNLHKMIKHKLKAKNKLLICYEKRKDLDKAIVKLKKQKSKSKIHIWIAPWDIEKIKEFRMIEIGGITKE